MNLWIFYNVITWYITHFQPCLSKFFGTCGRPFTLGYYCCHMILLSKPIYQYVSIVLLTSPDKRLENYKFKDLRETTGCNVATICNSAVIEVYKDIIWVCQIFTACQQFMYIEAVIARYVQKIGMNDITIFWPLIFACKPPRINSDSAFFLCIPTDPDIFSPQCKEVSIAVNADVLIAPTVP